MRFGVALPRAGPLTEPSAVSATVEAAIELGYSSLWVPRLSMLAAAARVGGRVALALLLPGDDEAAAFAELDDVPAALGYVAERLATVAQPAG